MEEISQRSASFPVYKCLRCGHEWVSRKLIGRPSQCPACHALGWDRPSSRKPREETKGI